MLCHNSQSSSIDPLIIFFSNVALFQSLPRKHLQRYAERELTHLSLGLTAQLILSEKYHHGIDDGELSLFLSLKTQSQPMDLVRFLTRRLLTEDLMSSYRSTTRNQRLKALQQLIHLVRFLVEPIDFFIVRAFTGYQTK